MAESRASIVFGRWGFKTVRPYLTQLLVPLSLLSFHCSYYVPDLLLLLLYVWYIILFPGFSVSVL